jgi:dephospho-CoA kinase
MTRPVRIGVTGSIGAGKSAFVEALARNGAASFSADAAVHAAYADEELRSQLIEHWGDAILADDGSVDRSAIARIVFADEAERRWLEGHVHPFAARAWLQFVDEQDRRDPPPPAIVAEVPLLFEAGLDERYDLTVTVDTPDVVRTERLQLAGDRADHRARAAAQLPSEEKARRADVVVGNDGTLDALDDAARQLLQRVASGELSVRQ